MDDATFIAQATTKICGSLEPKTVLRYCFDFLRDFMPVGSISMTVYDPKIHALKNVAYYLDPLTPHPDRINYFDKPLKFPPGVRDYVTSFSEETCTIANDASKDLAGKLVCEALGITELSYMVLRVKLGIGEGILGHIVVGSEGINMYTPEHARLLTLLQKPFSIAMTNAIQHQEVVRLKDLLSEDNRYLYNELRQNTGDTIIGQDRGLKEVMGMVRQVARLKNLVMLLGETGTGKEVIANAIHYNSPQANGPFIKINCGAIPENLIDSELFGHAKGAFTGAVSSKRGHFERAQNGTLFLDEIGDLPPSAQVRLLRVLQQKELIRVGGTQPIEVNARIIVATHHDLEEMVQNGDFRADLWFRINVFPIAIPPLRQRREDIPDLVAYFINRKSREMNLRIHPKVSALALNRLLSYDWPGNVRELENCVERALIHHVVGHQETVLNFEEIGEPVIREASRIKRPQTEPEVGGDASQAYDDISRQHLQKILKLTRGKIHGADGAAAMLKLNPSTLRHRLRKLGITFGREYGI